MKVDFSQPLYNLAGERLQTDGRPSTVGAVSSNALLSMFNGEQPTAEEKVRRFRIARIAFTDRVVELQAEDVALIKKVVAMAYAPLVVGQVFDLLEGGEGIAPPAVGPVEIVPAN